MSYYDRVRQTIASFDSLVVDILAKGATLVIAILIGPWSLLHFSSGGLNLTEVESIFKWVSWVSIAAVFASAYITFTVSLYADLLRGSAGLGAKLVKRPLLLFRGRLRTPQGSPMSSSRINSW
jgi:hypothetical protein